MAAAGWPGQAQSHAMQSADSAKPSSITRTAVIRFSRATPSVMETAIPASGIAPITAVR